jgi:pyruvate/2-oxoglutarate/acetoin dehydrogenase E1 component
MSVPFFGSDIDGAGCASNVENVAQRAASYDVPAMIVDGQDVAAVFLAVRKATEYARENSSMMMVEAKTYRYYGHSRSDPRAYRTKDEEKAWRERDPAVVLSKKLLDEKLVISENSDLVEKLGVGGKLVTQELLDAIRDKAFESIEASVQFGLDSAWPDPADLARDVYVEESYAVDLVEGEKIAAGKVAEATSVFERELATGSGGSKKQRSQDAQAIVKDKYGMDVVTIGQAVAAAQAEELRRDENVIILGEDVGLYGGAYGATKGLAAEFGVDRVIDTAISEAAITGAAVGAAIRGLRPIAEIMYVDFLPIAMDQLMHNGAFNRYMFGGHAKVPMVLRTEGGVGRCIAAHHSKSLEAMVMHIPGLYVVMPSTPYDAKGLLRAAIQSDNPVVFIEHKATYGQMGAVPDGDYIIPLGVADIKRAGKDVTIATYSRMTMFALEAAKTLQDDHGISAEVIDLRTLKPMDTAAVAESVRKTGRLITVSEAFGHCGVASEITRQVTEYEFDNGRCGFDYLDARPINLAAADVPPPMSEPLELASIPSCEKIVAAARSMV